MSTPEWYVVQANRTEKRGTWTASIQVPTFYLNARTQGIKNAEHAAKIASEILGPDCTHCVHLQAHGHTDHITTRQNPNAGGCNEVTKTS